MESRGSQVCAEMGCRELAPSWWKVGMEGMRGARWELAADPPQDGRRSKGLLPS
jgi:hypothetical protein